MVVVCFKKKRGKQIFQYLRYAKKRFYLKLKLVKNDSAAA